MAILTSGARSSETPWPDRSATTNRPASPLGTVTTIRLGLAPQLDASTTPNRPTTLRRDGNPPQFRPPPSDAEATRASPIPCFAIRARDLFTMIGCDVAIADVDDSGTSGRTACRRSNLGSRTARNPRLQVPRPRTTRQPPRRGPSQRLAAHLHPPPRRLLPARPIGSLHQRSFARPNPSNSIIICFVITTATVPSLHRHFSVRATRPHARASAGAGGGKSVARCSLGVAAWGVAGVEDAAGTCQVEARKLGRMMPGPPSRTR